MEVKKGYKQTEVGIIPEDWEVKTILNIANVLTGSTPPTNDKNNYGEEFLFVSPADLNNNKYVYNTDKKLSAKGFELSRKFPKDSILFTCIGSTIGKSGIASMELTSNQQINAVLPNANYSTDFLYYSLDRLSPQIKSSASEQAVPIINKSEFEKVLIPLPPKHEQAAIAQVLSDTDELISSLEKLIEKKKLIKQGVMQQLLTGKKRLPGFSGKWEVKKLGEIGEITSAGIDKKIRTDEMPVRLVNYLDVYHRNFIYSKDLNHWVTATELQAEKCRVMKGDVFFTPSSETPNDIGISSVAAEDIDNAGYSYHVVRLRLFEDWDFNFRAYIFKTRFFLEQAEKFCEGSGKRYVISLKRFRELEIFYPSDKKEQESISKVLRDMDSEIESLEQKLNKYKSIKQGMMQNLLTGKIRLV